MYEDVIKALSVLPPKPVDWWEISCKCGHLPADHEEGAEDAGECLVRVVADGERDWCECRAYVPDRTAKL